MKIDAGKFRVGPDERVRLKDWPTRVKPVCKSKGDYRKALASHVSALSDKQGLLYANDRHALLIVLQAMDAAGKDGVIKHVMSGVNPQGCEVFSFKHPSAQELQHDFLWRTTACLPERGRIGIFNRSYYEEILIVRVHPEILAAERLPGESTKGGGIWNNRFRSINEFERHLHRNGTRVVKFFLHVSKEEQRRRFLARIEEPQKNWKLSGADLEERKRWKDYMEAYEECLSATSTGHAPWFIIPADDKETAHLLVSKAILDALDGLKMSYPKTDKAQRRELTAIRRKLEKEG